MRSTPPGDAPTDGRAAGSARSRAAQGGPMNRFLRRVLREPSYGWATADHRPTDAQIRAEWRSNLAVWRDRRHLLTAFTWGVWAVMVGLLAVWLVGYATVPSLLAGLAYAFLFLPQYGTFYFHRYGVHGAWTYRHPVFAWLAKHAALRLIPEEVYVVSHHVHHAYADQDGDPYDPRGGWWYCFLADANHQSVAWDLDPAEHQRAVGMLRMLPVRAGSWATYRRWGMLAHPGWLVLDFVGNWLFWGLVWTWVGGPSLALAIFGWSAAWLWGIRNFNYRAHGRGVDLRIDGEDFHRGDLSVNRTLSAWLASEWHNNHHLFPRSARNGFLWWQLDVVWWTVRALAAVGIVRQFRDDSARFRQVAAGSSDV